FTGIESDDLDTQVVLEVEVLNAEMGWGRRIECWTVGPIEPRPDLTEVGVLVHRIGVADDVMVAGDEYDPSSDEPKLDSERSQEVHGEGHASGVAPVEQIARH